MHIILFNDDLCICQVHWFVHLRWFVHFLSWIGRKTIPDFVVVGNLINLLLTFVICAIFLHVYFKLWLKESVLMFKECSAATLSAQLEIVFKDTSWPKILHVKTEFHLTFLHGQTVSRLLMEKKVGMFLKTKIGYYIEKFPKIAVKHFCMPSSFCPLEVTFLKIANVIYCRCFFLCVPFWCWTTCDFLFSAK